MSCQIKQKEKKKYNFLFVRGISGQNTVFEK